MRTCPFHGCKVVVHDSVFACKRHWFSLNATQRQTIYSAYDDYMTDKISMEELRRIQQSVLDQTTIGGEA